jgi:transposase
LHAYSFVELCMFALLLSATERQALDAALAEAADRRSWRRLRAVRLMADGLPPDLIQTTLGVGHSSLYAWQARYLARRNPAALAERPRSGRPPSLDGVARARLAALLAEAPQAHGYHTFGWTAALLQHHLAVAEGLVVSETTVRRTLHALGYRWKRPRYVLARRDPARAEKKGGARGPSRRRPGPAGAAHRGALRG